MTKSLVYILDMDGVVVNTIPLLYEIFNEFLSENGVQASASLFDHYNGMRLETIIKDMKERFAIPGKPEDLCQDYQLRMQQVYNRATIFSGCIDFLHHCKVNHIPVCLATSSKRENIDTIFERFKLSEYFTYTVAGDEVKCNKPDPETYEIIRNALGNHYFLVVDDSPKCLEAARSIGMDAIIFDPTQKYDEGISFGNFNDILLLNGSLQIKSSQKTAFIGEVEIVSRCRYVETGERVQEFWERKIAKNPKEFNGRFLLLKSLVPSVHGNFCVEVFESDYKTYSFLSVSRGLPIISIGVSGVVFMDGKILVGKRADWVDNYSGYLEFPPSGNLVPGKIPSEHLLTELEEEVGIPNSFVSEVSSLGFFYDNRANFVDLVFKIHLKESILNYHSNEYQWMRFYDFDEILELLIKGNVVPTSLGIWNEMITHNM